jgi:hypothetical protein
MNSIEMINEKVNKLPLFKIASEKGEKITWKDIAELPRDFPLYKTFLEQIEMNKRYEK